MYYKAAVQISAICTETWRRWMQHWNRFDFLQCTVCKGEFSEPRTLPCMQTFCLNCLQQHRNGRSDAPCPMCSQTYVIPPQGLPRNVFIDRQLVMTQFLLESSKRKLISCDLCDPGVEAVSCCIDCRQRLCQACCTRHARLNCSVQHHLVPLQDKPSAEQMKKLKASYCVVHPSDEITLYCQQLWRRDMWHVLHWSSRQPAPQQHRRNGEEISPAAEEDNETLQSLCIGCRERFTESGFGGRRSLCEQVVTSEEAIGIWIWRTMLFASRLWHLRRRSPTSAGCFVQQSIRRKGGWIWNWRLRRKAGWRSSELRWGEKAGEIAGGDAEELQGLLRRRETQGDCLRCLEGWARADEESRRVDREERGDSCEWCVHCIQGVRASLCQCQELARGNRTDW